MPTDQRAALRKIRTFPSLVRYLRDEMGWPIETDDFEELVFEYTPEELGIDAKNAAKIDEIKRLRPLATHQPWGIFFVKFEPKRLPVVALRRILSQVALKKRASANPAERTAWAADDLLFVSNYGEGDERQISFAHFSQPESNSHLPTLRVLGWDNLDTPLHLDDVAEKLTRDLAWPADESRVAEWRTAWSSAFTLRHREVITTAQVLSVRLAELARVIRDRILSAIEIETDEGPLKRLLNAFREALVDDLDAAGFADMYAQTIAYGLLSARLTTPKGATAEDLPAQIPLTNPFLKELMETFLHVGRGMGKANGSSIDFDELGVSEVVQLLDDARMEAVLRDFGDRNPLEDPVIHFYELFLGAYDRAQKVKRGVFYTPRPVVSYIVRSVDQLLRKKFGLEDGLADTTTWGELVERNRGLTIPDGVEPGQAFVQILDPATGTGTFLVEVIDLIHGTMIRKWRAEGLRDETLDDLWNDYVSRHLLPRLHGFELLMAPYAIAHLKVGLKLYETGYLFESKERLRIFLTNSLEEPHDIPGQFEGASVALAHEAQAVNSVKTNQLFTVIIGNPPYSNFGQQNRNAFILGLLDTYKRGLQEKKINLDDDFIKFIRFSQWLLERAQLGIVMMITSNTFLEGLTHRQMRRSLAEFFDFIQVLDLHGNIRKKEVAPDGSKDENIFDIQQGVAISAFVRRNEGGRSSRILHEDLWGQRVDKFKALLSAEPSALGLHEVSLREPNLFFAPKDAQYESEYHAFYAIDQVFETWSSGIQTKRDSLTIQFGAKELEQIIIDFASMGAEELRSRYDLPPDGRDWTIDGAKRDLAANSPQIIDVMYRPFDVRKTLWTGKTKGFIGYPRADTMSSMLLPNIGMNLKRQMQDLNWSYATVSRNVVESAVHFSTPSNPHFFPLYRYETGLLARAAPSEPGDGLARFHNLSSQFVSAISTNLGLVFIEDGAGDCVEVFGPEDAFAFVYAVLHSPTYRSRYAEMLKVDFPRIPLPLDTALFRLLVHVGIELISLHLLESRADIESGARYSGPRNPVVRGVDWFNETVWLDALGKDKTKVRGTAGFHGVPEVVWSFRMGGYRVCEKWLKDRKGRTLSDDDIAHYQLMIAAISETIRLMAAIDEVIAVYGGWPGAFAASVEQDMPWHT